MFPETTFQQRLAELNPEQRMAVEALEGPVMVIAGPGTGKTQILGMRIANILQKTQCNPQNILALTFTESGVVAMRDRLRSIIGTASYSVAIHTFHSFCNTLIQEWPELFFFARELEHITTLEQLRLLRTVVDELSLEQIKPYYAPYHYQSAILSAISILKRENISADDFLRILTTEKEQFDANPDVYHQNGRYKGVMKSEYKKAQKYWRKNKELQLVHSMYQQKLQKLGRYDYDDMILFVVKVLRENEDFRLTYQQRYEYILIDEYQDTNNAQNEIVRLLGSYWENPNIFVVGDDDQSIYRFQGAALENILNFQQLYPAVSTIVLRKNYRSTQGILDASRLLICNNTERLESSLPEVNKQLEAVAQVKGPAVSVVEFSNRNDEAYFITTKIKELLDKGISPQEIAVLYRNNKDASQLVELLSRAGIAFSISSGKNILDTVLIGQFTRLLSLIAFPERNDWYFEVMQYNFWGMDSLDVLKIHSYFYKNRNDEHSLIELLNKTNVLESCAVKNPAQFSWFAAKVLEWQKASNNMAFPAFIEQVMHESGFITSIYQQCGDDEILLVKNLNIIRSFFNNLQTLGIRQYRFGLRQFIDDIELLEETKTTLQEDDLELEQQAVQLMTAHKAKGLEFAHVFIVQCYDKHWGNATERNLLQLPAEIVRQQTTSEEKENTLEEDRRLFFVAMTRAKQELVLTYAREYKEGGEVAPSVFITNLLDSGSHVQHTVIEPSLELTKQALELGIKPQPIEDYAGEEEAHLRALLKEFVLSPTALEQYQVCPRKFKYSSLIRVPGVKQKGAIFGSCIHRALQVFFSMYKKNKQVPAKEVLLTNFTQALNNEIIGELDYHETLKRGTTILSRYYDYYASRWTDTVLELEYTFKPVYLDTIPLKGILDKIECIDEYRKTVNVVDYKTGKVRSRNAILGETESSRGEYFQQLTFYKLLASLDPFFPYQVRYGEIDFIQSKDEEGLVYVKERFEISEQDVGNLRQAIGETWEKIQKLQFPKKKKRDEDCDQCPYCNLCWKTNPL